MQLQIEFTDLLEKHTVVVNGEQNYLNSSHIC
jgi:hypothetical protein